MAASPEMQKFFEYLSQHQDVQDRFRGIKDQDEAIATAVSVASDNGFKVDADEMRQWVAQDQGGDEKLPREMLEQVAGGAACWTKTGGGSCSCDSGYCSSGC